MLFLTGFVKYAEKPASFALTASPLLAIEVVITATLPRQRIDRTLMLCWSWILPVAMFNIAVTAAVLSARNGGGA